jgi:hypothetical protein
VPGEDRDGLATDLGHIAEESGLNNKKFHCWSPGL